MDPFQGIVVQILSNGQSLTLYDDPDSDDVTDGDSRRRYVEATTGATFSVRVTLTTEFNLYHLRPLDAIRITLNLDGNNWKISLSRKRIEGHFLLGQPYEYTWSRITQFCPTTGQWITSELTFGKLEISIWSRCSTLRTSLTSTLGESTNISLPVDQAKNLGRMSVRTQRVKRERRSVLGPPSKRSVSTVKEVAEKALKGRSIANAVR